MRHHKHIAINVQARAASHRILWTGVFLSAFLAPKGAFSFVALMALSRICALSEAFSGPALPSKKDRFQAPVFCDVPSPMAKWLTYAVSKNKTLQNLQKPDAVVQTVVKAFESGVLSEALASDPDLDLYLVQATRMGAFSSDAQCLDAWQRLTWMQQCSELQPIAKALASTKMVLTEDPIFYTKTEALSLVDHAVARLREFGVVPTSGQIETSKAAVSVLTVGQRFGLPVPAQTDISADMQVMLDTLWEVSPFVFPVENKALFMSPSASLQACLMYLMPHPPAFKAVPVLGKIGDATSVGMHREGLHPSNVHSIHVRSNPSEVHGAMVGPFLGLMHDEYHVVTSCLLPATSHAFLFERLIPYLETVSPRYPQWIRTIIEESGYELSHFVLNYPSKKTIEVRPFRRFEDFVKDKLWPYTDRTETSYQIGALDSYYVELNVWLKAHAPELMLEKNPYRPTPIMDFLEWCVAVGAAESVSAELAHQREERLCAIQNNVSYEGLPVYLQEILSRSTVAQKIA